MNSLLERKTDHADAAIVDIHNRTFKKLRISLTSACNFSCKYCVSSKNMKVERSNYVAPQQILHWVQSIQRVTPLDSVRLTGGEPSLYRDLPELIRRLKEAGIPQVGMTTNGSLLNVQAGQLAAAGLDSVNISLDAVNEQEYKRMGGRRYQQVQSSLQTALEAGLNVKINATILQNINDNQIIPLLELAMRHNIIIRFLELMPMGYLFGSKDELLVSADDILKIISNKYSFTALPREKSSTSNYYKLSGGSVFGIIGNHSTPFCRDCDRLRLDTKGNVYGCLSNEKGIALDSDKTRDALQLAMEQKQIDRFSGSSLSMRYIGG